MEKSEECNEYDEYEQDDDFETFDEKSIDISAKNLQLSTDEEKIDNGNKNIDDYTSREEESYDNDYETDAPTNCASTSAVGPDEDEDDDPFADDQHVKGDEDRPFEYEINESENNKEMSEGNFLDASNDDNAKENNDNDDNDDDEPNIEGMDLQMYMTTIMAEAEPIEGMDDKENNGSGTGDNSPSKKRLDPMFRPLEGMSPGPGEGRTRYATPDTLDNGHGNGDKRGVVGVQDDGDMGFSPRSLTESCHTETFTVSNVNTTTTKVNNNAAAASIDDNDSISINDSSSLVSLVSINNNKNVTVPVEDSELDNLQYYKSPTNKIKNNNNSNNNNNNNISSNVMEVDEEEDNDNDNDNVSGVVNYGSKPNGTPQSQSPMTNTNTNASSPTGSGDGSDPVDDVDEMHEEVQYVTMTKESVDAMKLEMAELKRKLAVINSNNNSNNSNNNADRDRDTDTILSVKSTHSSQFQLYKQSGGGGGGRNSTSNTSSSRLLAVEALLKGIDLHALATAGHGHGHGHGHSNGHSESSPPRYNGNGNVNSNGIGIGNVSVPMHRKRQSGGGGGGGSPIPPSVNNKLKSQAGGGGGGRSKLNFAAISAHKVQGHGNGSGGNGTGKGGGSIYGDEGGGSSPYDDDEWEGEEEDGDGEGGLIRDDQSSVTSALSPVPSAAGRAGGGGGGISSVVSSSDEKKELKKRDENITLLATACLDLKKQVGALHKIVRSQETELQCDALSSMFTLDESFWERMHTFRLEWQPGPEGYVHWYIDNEYKFGVEASGLEFMKTRIPEEPSYLIINTAISNSWGFPDPPWGCTEYDCKTAEGKCGVWPGFCEQFPVDFEMDSIRVYQKKGDPYQTIGCNPEKFPTRKFIEAHEYRYKRQIDVHALKPLRVGGGRCKVDSDCGEGTGKCLSNSKCRCEDGWVGPRCLVPHMKNDFEDWDRDRFITIEYPFIPSFLGLAGVIFLFALGAAAVFVE
eukprot:gene1781-3454_t